LPVDALAFWIQGAPRPNAPFASEPSADGTLRVLRQDGWTIVYQAFAADAADAVRPTRMTLSYPDIELRLVVDSWQ
jgi:outer membrane biogenesis lipoprotein LolB